MVLDVLIIAFVGVLASLWWRWRIESGRTRAVLPRELRTAQLIYAERLFRSAGPVSITAKVDRVYRNGAGKMVLLELKTRRVSRICLSDVIELSAQRIAVMAQTGEHVAGHAYVLIEGLERKKWASYRVKLMQHNELTALAVRREALLVGEADAHYAQSRVVCRTCAFRKECHSPNSICLQIS